MRRPVSVLPVNTYLAMSGWRVNASPVTAPLPVTTLTTPAGKPASMINSASASVEALACSDGLITIVLPMARHGARVPVSSIKGEFHGVIMPTTPNGSRLL